VRRGATGVAICPGEAAGIFSGEKFDYIIASDLVNDLAGCAGSFVERLHQWRGKRIRGVVLKFSFNNFLASPFLGRGPEKMRAKRPPFRKTGLSLGDAEKTCCGLLAAGSHQNRHANFVAGAHAVAGSTVQPLAGAALEAPCLTIFVVARPRPSRGGKAIPLQRGYFRRATKPGNRGRVERTPENGRGHRDHFHRRPFAGQHLGGNPARWPPKIRSAK